MDFMVLVGGSVVPLALLAAVALPQAPQRPRRFVWLLPLAFSNVFFALAYISAHRWGESVAIWWECAAGVTLLTGMVSYLLIPRSQR